VPLLYVRTFLGMPTGLVIDNHAIYTHPYAHLVIGFVSDFTYYEPQYIVVHSRDDEGVGVAHESPKNQPKFL